MLDLFLERLHMGDDAHQPVALGQAGQGEVGLVQRLGVQAAKALIHEQGVQTDAGRHLHLVRQAQGQGQGG